MDGEEAQLELDLRAFTYAGRSALLPALTRAIDLAGGWILERRATSSATVTVALELQCGALPEVYGAMLASGLELTRDSQRIMAERCNCSLHLRPSMGVPSILAIRLEIHFLVDDAPALDLTRLLRLGSASA